MKMIWRHLILLIALAVVMVPVSADAGNSSNTTTVATTAATTLNTTAATTVATAVTTTTVNATATTTVPTTTTAAPVTTNQTTAPATTATTVPTVPVTHSSSGDISVASSPLGAAILIDGVYYGTTPGNVTGLASGNHIIRLALSGYTDYEGTMYVVAGQSTPVYGTLHPVSGPSSPIIIATASAPLTSAVPVTTVVPTPTQTSSGGALDNPTVLAALIGIVTACIGAGATIFTHNANIKKQEEKKP